MRGLAFIVPRYYRARPLFTQRIRLSRFVPLRKLTVCLLTFLFILGPVWPAFAQAMKAPAAIDQGITVPAETMVESSPTEVPLADVLGEEQTAPVEESTPTSETTPEEQIVAEDKTAEEETAPENSPQMNPGEQSSAQQNSALKNQPKLPEADESTGALVYRYPIEVPPGRNGLQPQFELTYNSQNAEEGSLLGYGWSLSIPSIERQNKHGAEQMYARHDFTSSLSGELVDLSSGNFGPKVESGEFLSYTFASNTWTVKDKKGATYKFGATTQALQDDPADSSKVYKWMLEEVRDTNDNFVRYEYFKDQGQIYPGKIFYTGSGSTDGPFEVELVRESRTDVVKSYSASFTLTTTYRIYEIQSKVNGDWVRKFTLSYSAGSNGYRSLLIGIAESGKDEANTLAALPQTHF